MVIRSASDRLAPALKRMAAWSRWCAGRATNRVHATKAQWIVRAVQDRRLQRDKENANFLKLWKTLEQAPILGYLDVEVKLRPNRAGPSSNRNRAVARMCRGTRRRIAGNGCLLIDALRCVQHIRAFCCADSRVNGGSGGLISILSPEK
jgi:hypothetical protein